MNKTVKKYLSFFFVFSFLFPQIEKAIHDFQHRNIEHCSVKNQTHFHSEEHSCSLCDYSVPESSKPTDVKIATILTAYSVYYFPSTHNLTIQEADQKLPSRAPPIA